MESSEGLYARHAKAPEEHDRGYEPGWPESFEEYIGQWLEASVRHEEHRQTDVVLAVTHLQVVRQAVDVGIADVRPIYLWC